MTISGGLLSLLSEPYAAALQIWSPTFSKAFDSLPRSVREGVQQKVDEMGARLNRFPHKRLAGRPEFKLRVGDYDARVRCSAPGRWAASPVKHICSFRNKQFQGRKIIAQVSAVAGEQALCVHHRVRADQEISDNAASFATASHICSKDFAGQQRTLA
jgi:hypothetical protein